MRYSESKCRFLREYANFKISYLKEREANDRDISADIQHIESCCRAARNGLITLDEAMREIANAGHNTIWL